VAVAVARWAVHFLTIFLPEYTTYSERSQEKTPHIENVCVLFGCWTLGEYGAFSGVLLCGLIFSIVYYAVDTTLAPCRAISAKDYVYFGAWLGR